MRGETVSSASGEQTLSSPRVFRSPIITQPFGEQVNAYFARTPGAALTRLSLRGEHHARSELRRLRVENADGQETSILVAQAHRLAFSPSA